MRLLAGLPVTREDITGLGVGGLLMEIIVRSQPRCERRLISRYPETVVEVSQGEGWS